MNKKELKRQQWLDRLSSTRTDLYPDRSVYDIAKEQSKLEREANKLLRKGKHGKNELRGDTTG